MRTPKLIALGATALVLAAPAPATAKTVFAGIHAHRGGANTGGVASHPENSLEGFKAAHKLGADVIELDAKLTADNVPVIMHDATIDRTTNCTGQVRQHTAADLAANCRIDTLGTEALIKPTTGAGVPIPTLAEVLAWAKDNKVKLHLEIKNQPTDPDYDSTPGFAQTVLNAVIQSGIPKGNVLIQSFWPANLDQAKAAGFATTLLLLQQGSNQQGIDLAKQNGYTVVSPGWPTAEDPEDFIAQSHRAGKPVIPYTIDDEGELARATALGADGIITNDPKLGLQRFYGPVCDEALGIEQRRTKTYNKRLRAYRREKNAARKRKLRKSALSARKALTRAKKNRKAICAKAGA
jgi:glycerophosphoryl diester phosphodiesterase